MSVYMSRLFSKSNSSFFLRSGNALQAKVVRTREHIYLVDAGVGQPRIATRDELIGVPKSDGPAHFTNRVGFLSPSSRETPVRNQLLERTFVDLITGDQKIKDRASAKFADMVGESEVVGGGEMPLLLPRKYRKRRAGVELVNKARVKAKVKGFIVEKTRRGYAVAIAGYIAFLSGKQFPGRKHFGDKFRMEKMNPKTLDIVVTQAS